MLSMTYVEYDINVAFYICNYLSLMFAIFFFFYYMIYFYSDTSGSGGRPFTVLVFHDGDKVHMYTLMERGDCTVSPISGAIRWLYLIQNFFF